MLTQPAGYYSGGKNSEICLGAAKVFNSGVVIDLK
jgi:hypothetical protein